MLAEHINVPGVESLPESVRAESSGRISVGSKYLFCSANGLKLPTTASLVYCSGQIAAQGDGTNKKLLEGSIADKTAFILDNLEKVLKAGGSSLNQLVKVNIYITDFGFFSELNKYYAERIPNPKPPRTCVQVAALPFGAEIEIEAIGYTE